MIGTIDIGIQAASPNLPLRPVFAFRDSWQNVRIAGVPGRIGTWAVAKVRAQVEFPDNAMRLFDCRRTQSGKDELWTCTIDPCTTVGSTAKGFSVVAQDEDGNEYVLGKGDLYVLDSDEIVKPGEQKWTMRLVDSQGENPAKGDVFLGDGGSLSVYDGEEWRKAGAGGGGPVSSDVTWTANNVMTYSEQGLEYEQLPISAGSLVNFVKMKVGGADLGPAAVNRRPGLSALDITADFDAAYLGNPKTSAAAVNRNNMFLQVMDLRDYSGMPDERLSVVFTQSVGGSSYVQLNGGVQTVPVPVLATSYGITGPQNSFNVQYRKYSDSNGNYATFDNSLTGTGFQPACAVYSIKQSSGGESVNLVVSYPLYGSEDIQVYMIDRNGSGSYVMLTRQNNSYYQSVHMTAVFKNVQTFEFQSGTEAGFILSINDNGFSSSYESLNIGSSYAALDGYTYAVTVK